MNKYEQFVSEKRNQTLLIVEGKHEKFEMLNMLLKVFPEIPLDMENIHIYNADIYDLYLQIVKEYEDDWYENGCEVNIPMLISRRLNITPQLDKRNFTNIILMFDYEHHDTSYSDEKIYKMQSHFNSISDDGILYINYPMIESYQHIFTIPDTEYSERYVRVACNKGSEYKNLVHEKSLIWKYLVFYQKLCKTINKFFSNISKDNLDTVINRLLAIDNSNMLLEKVGDILKSISIAGGDNTLQYTIAHQIQELNYTDEGLDFWAKLRQIILYTATQNIVKAWKLQKDLIMLDEKKTKEMYLELNFEEILMQQNEVSRGFEDGIIWVLCTCITFLGEYKFFWNYITD